MKKNGFTLAELLGVMVILSLISIITVPAVTESLNNYKTKLCVSQINEIISAAKSWGNENVLVLPSGEGESYDVSLRTLAEYGYIDEKVNNPVTNENFDLDTTVVTITKKGKKYKYTMDSTTVDTCYSNGVKKSEEVSNVSNVDLEQLTNLKIVYTNTKAGLHTNYSIKASIGMGTKYVWTYNGVSLPHDSLAECKENGGTDSQCTAKTFNTPNITYSKTLDTSWKMYFKIIMNISDVIKNIYTCGKTNGKEFCLENGDGTRYAKNKTILVSAFGSSNCTDNGTYYTCNDGKIYGYARNDGRVYINDGTNECIVFNGGAAACHGN